MDAETYDGWYDTPRGRWIGQREIGLLIEGLQPRPGESLLDVGCGTGYFTRALAGALQGSITGVDINPDWAEYARRRDAGTATYEVADARALPYADASFDLVISVAALCFIDDEVRAAGEILRVCRRRFAIGFLNRQSLLYLEKGRGGGRGGYRAARWHTVGEVRDLFRTLPVRRLRVCTAIRIPSGGWLARQFERAWPFPVPGGGFILAVGDVAGATGQGLATGDAAHHG